MRCISKASNQRLDVAGTTIEKVQNVGSTPTVTFQTVPVTVELRDSSATLMDEGSNLKYRNGSWQTFGSGSTLGGAVGQETMQLLPKTYRFSLTFAGATIEKVHNVGSTPSVTFQTGKVIPDSGTAIQYRNGTWNTFVNPMELLPKSYRFRFNDGTPETIYAVVAASDNHIH